MFLSDFSNGLTLPLLELVDTISRCSGSSQGKEGSAGYYAVSLWICPSPADVGDFWYDNGDSDVIYYDSNQELVIRVIPVPLVPKVFRVFKGLKVSQGTQGSRSQVIKVSKVLQVIREQGLQGATGVDYDDNVKVRFGDDEDMEQFFDGTRLQNHTKTSSTTQVNLILKQRIKFILLHLDNGTILKFRAMDKALLICTVVPVAESTSIIMVMIS